MNREILFKAKRKNWRELPKEKWWVEGFPFMQWLDGNEVCCIGASSLAANDFSEIVGRSKLWYEIDPKTLCQYTGLTDKNGKRIWENDIVRCGDGTVLRVSWHTFKASWVLSKKGWMYNHFFGEGVEPEDVEVIGNIFDTPELLKED